MAEAKKTSSEYVVTLTLTQKEAEDLRGLLYAHVAGKVSRFGGTLGNIQYALSNAGVEPTDFKVQVSSISSTFITVEYRNES